MYYLNLKPFMKSDKVYIEQLLDAVQKIELFTAGMTKEQFLNDVKTQSATILQLALIGEISKKISEDMKKKIALPWKDIAGFRDKAIHDYFQLDLEVVWGAVQIDIPVVKSEFNKTL